LQDLAVGSDARAEEATVALRAQGTSSATHNQPMAKEPKRPHLVSIRRRGLASPAAMWPTTTRWSRKTGPLGYDQSADVFRAQLSRPCKGRARAQEPSLLARLCTNAFAITAHVEHSGRLFALMNTCAGDRCRGLDG
jgi:hypothetical protein